MRRSHLLTQALRVIRDAARAGDESLIAERHADAVVLRVPLDPAAHLTRCERDVLAVVRAVDPRPITTTRLLAELQRRGLHHGESTVKVALSHLVRIEHLRSSRRRPRGYRVSVRSE